MKPVRLTDAKLIEIATEFREGLLDGGSSDGLCAAMSWALAGYLTALCGVDCEVVESDLYDSPYEWENHIWIRLPDGRCLDATADQFPDMPPVYLGPPLDMHGAA